MPLSSLHKGTIVSAPSPLLSKALRVTCLRVVLGRYQRRSLTFFAFVQAYVAEVIRYSLHQNLFYILSKVSLPVKKCVLYCVFIFYFELCGLFLVMLSFKLSVMLCICIYFISVLSVLPLNFLPYKSHFIH